MDAALNQQVKKLYQAAYESPISEFKARCFELLSGYFEIDSGTWITRCEREMPFYDDDSFCYRLPDGFMEDYHHLSTVSTQVHQVFSVMMGNLGKTLDILDVVPEEEWFGSDMYRLYCEKFDLHHSLMTVTMNPVNQAINVVTFARHDAERPFSQEIKSAKEFVVPNLIEALRVNILNAFQSGSSNESFRAVSDRYGNMIEAEEGFLSLGRQFGLIQDNKWQLDLTQSGAVSADDYVAEYTNHDGLVYIELKTPSVLEQLTAKQRAVCHELLEGQSNKEIARVLSIAPDTVNNHLKAVYKILGVASRHQAVAYLARQDWA
jgi:DNA-binding CsgD family transcriptional regulator